MRRLKNPKTANLSIDQLRALFLMPCETKEHFKLWIETFWNISLPDCKVSRYATISVLDAYWEVYKCAIFEKKGMNSLICAPRGGFKTIGVAILESMLLLHDKRGVVHVGAIEDQAKRAYEYFINFIGLNKRLMHPLITKTTVERTKLVIDGIAISYEVLPCTIRALNGPHQPMVVADELDTLSGEGLKAYKQMHGIPVKHPHTGAPAIMVGISTRKSAYGLVQAQMDNAEKQGRKVNFWTILDIMERCPVERHGEGLVDAYVLQKDMRCLSKDGFVKLPEESKADWAKYELPPGCLSCPLASCCLGDARYQMCTASTLQAIDAVITQVKGGDVDWVLAELMCLKPSVEGVVFREFEKGRHVTLWAKMWKTLTGETAPDDCGHDMFLRELHKRKVPIYAGLDWGWTSPSAITILAIDEQDYVYVLKAFQVKNMNDPTFIHYCKTRFHKKYKIQMYYPDVANGSGVDLMKQAGLPVASKIDKSENLGVQVIKRLLNVPGTNESRMLIAPEGCEPLIHEFERYHYETDAAGNCIDGKFAKENDHNLDGLRYPLTMLMGKSRMVVSSDIMLGNENPCMAPDGSYLRAPTFYELADQHAIPVLTPEVRPFDKPDNEEGDTDEMNAGVSWSF